MNRVQRDLNPKGYVWKAKGAQILAKINRTSSNLEKSA